jgi:hypothetical protein
MGGLRRLGITTDNPTTPEALKAALEDAQLAICIVNKDSPADLVLPTIKALPAGTLSPPWIGISNNIEALKPHLAEVGIQPVVWIPSDRSGRKTLGSVVEYLQSRGIHGLDLVKPQRTKPSNIRREKPLSVLIAIAATLFLLGAILGYLVSPDQPTIVTQTPPPPAPSPLMEERRPAPTLPPMGPPVVNHLAVKYRFYGELAGPPDIVGPPYIPPPPEFAIMPDSPPVLSGPAPIWTREAKAIVHVISTIDEANRVKGLSEDRLEALVQRFTDPTYIEGLGEQSHDGMKASIQLRAESWPAWREVPSSVTARADGDNVLVQVTSRYRAENRQHSKVITDDVIVTYTVQFKPQLEVPFIRRVEISPPQSKRSTTTSETDVGSR